VAGKKVPPCAVLFSLTGPQVNASGIHFFYHFVFMSLREFFVRA